MMTASKEIALLGSLLITAAALQPSFPASQVKERDIAWYDSTTQTRSLMSDRKSRLAMAICMSGAARTVIDDDVQEGFKRHVRNNMARGLSDSKPDLFMYVRTGDSGSAAMIVNRSAVEKAVSTLKPTSSKIIENAGLYSVPYNAPESGREQMSLTLGLSNSTCFTDGYWANNSNFARNLNMYEGWSQCHSMIEERETEVQRQYDVVMFVRPDILWTQDVPSSYISTDSATFFVDWWQVVPRTISKDIANIYQNFIVRADTPCCRCRSSEDLVRCAADHICMASNQSCLGGARSSNGEMVKRAGGHLFEFTSKNDEGNTLTEDDLRTHSKTPGVP